ncbi:MAG: BatD family protein [Desulfuromonas sp.]|nr:BatD family protein [Desulfuromonas sp.]
MVKQSVIIATLLIIVSSIALAASSAAPQLTASVSRNQIGIDESLTLELTLSGDSGDEPDLTQLKQDFDIVSHSQSSSVNIINGSVSRSKVWSMILLPRRSGTLTIPALCSGSICSQPRTISVSEQPPATASSSAPVILETEASALSVTVQQQLLYTVRILIRQPLAQAGLSELTPQGVETTVHQLGEDVRYETQRGSYNYQVIERNYALFPQHSGTLQLPALRLDGILPASRIAAKSAFNSPFDPFDLMGQQGKRIRVRSKALSVKVVAAPVHDAQQPWLPALDIQLSDDWRTNPPTLTVGEPTTRTLIVSSTGLPAAALPELNLSVPNGFKSYPDKSERKDGNSAEGIEGTLIQKMALVPTQAGTFTLAATSMRWWDTQKQQWRTATIPAIELRVLPAQREATSPPAPLPPLANAGTNPPAAPTMQSTSAPTATEQAAKRTNLPQEPTAAAAQGSSPVPLLESVKANIWLWICLLCVGGWLTTIYLFRRQSRSRSEINANISHDKHEIASSALNHKQGGNIPASLQNVIRCAQAHQAADTRHALTLWITTLAPEYNILTLDDFLHQAAPPLRQEITFLNQYLYAHNSAEESNSTVWDGTTLAHELQQWQTEKQQSRKEKTAGGKDGTDLPSFYPEQH